MLVSGDARRSVEQPAPHERDEHIGRVTDGRDQPDGGACGLDWDGPLFEESEVDAAQAKNRGTTDEDVGVEDPRRRRHRFGQAKPRDRTRSWLQSRAPKHATR